jgi:ribonuclease HI
MPALISTIFSDGGARGNPGPAACAFVCISDTGSVVHKDSKYLGSATNNFAEYQGVIQALGWLNQNKNLMESSITFNLDSELVTNQINGTYKVKEATLKKLMLLIRNLLDKASTKIIFKSVPREKNKLADFLVNEELDRNFS